jgi:UDP-N-acetylmuramoyl-tripeptide--D-alanyl-D-alanine ligase
VIPRTLSQIAADVDGTLTGTGEVVVTGAAADSRAVQPGDIFVAIEGARVDGHAFVGQAAAAGAVAMLSRRAGALPAVLVPDPVAALGRLAAHVVADLPALAIVGVTGSSGKTTTKDLLAAVLALRGPVVAPVGSLNTEVGLPLTAIRCDGGTRTLIAEMGSRGIGHVAYLCEIAPPDVGVVLNVGSAHVGEFGSRELIARAKGELVEALPAHGTAVLNADDPLVARMVGRTDANVLTYGMAHSADLRITDLTLDAAARPSFGLLLGEQEGHVDLRLSGEHNAGNAAAAAAAGCALGLPLAQVCAALSEASLPSRWRMEVREAPGGFTVVNDAYNANPEATTAALKALAEMGRATGGRTWAVLGEMKELGPASADEHDTIGRLAVRLNIGGLVVVGEGARAMHLAAAHEGSWNGESQWVPDVATATEAITAAVAPGDVVLVKASRSVGLEAVADALLAAGDGS